MKNLILLKKGINLGGWLSQCVLTYEHYDSFITKDEIKMLAGWGIDHVRLPFDYELLETAEGKRFEKGFEYIDKCIEWCREYNINVILDLHKAVGYFFMDANTEANELFTSDDLKDRFVDLWKTVAERYGKYKDCVAFELLNEVVENKFSDAWNELTKRTFDAIREYAPDTVIIIGGVNWNSVFAVKHLPAPYDENILYSFHIYEPLVFTHQKAYWVPELAKSDEIKFPLTLEEIYKLSNILSEDHMQTLKKAAMIGGVDGFFERLFMPAIEYAKSMGTTLHCGEYGVIDKAPVESTLIWFREINSTFEKFGISRAVWSFKEMDFGLADEHYAPIRDELIKLL